MKRSLWIEPITKKFSPAWPCPTCSNGTLALVPDSLVAKETQESKQRYQAMGDPKERVRTFSAWLKCNHGDCGADVVVVGRGTFDRIQIGWREDGEPEDGHRDNFHPLFCWPMPDIFELPEKCPDEVKAELRGGFQLFWSDHAASASRVRIALERLMDHCHVPKRRKENKGTYSDLMLHKRIEIFSQTQKATGEKLMALKWLGNTGSHQGSLSRNDLLDGFEILEYLIAELFAQRTARVEELTRQLIRKHSPHRK